MIHWKSSSRSLLLFGALGGAAATLGLPPPPASAQKPADKPKPAAEGAPAPEAELPDMEAIEKGAAPPASMSFGKRKPPAPPRSTTLTGGEPAPGEAAGTRNIENAAAGLGAPGGLYGVESGPSPAGGGEGAGDSTMSADTPELHVVKKGDTLWSLCGQYFGDPWTWPRLWAQNPSITNPHWIFPGDVVRLKSAGAGGRPQAAPAESAPLVTSTRKGSLDSNALVLRGQGYVQASELAVSARITGSREEKIMLSTGDQAYLSFPKDRPLRAGERYTVFVADMKKPVKDPQTGAVLGYIVRIYGDVVVDQIADGQSARGTLVDVADPIERGFHVSPLVRQFQRVEPRPSNVSLEARVVASLSAANMLSADNFVVLSRGSKDGIQVGNRTFVVRRGDGYRRVMEGWDKFDPTYPKEVVGELWVVDVKEATSLAWIARSSKEIRVGETTEMRKGY